MMRQEAGMSGMLVKRKMIREVVPRVKDGDDKPYVFEESLSCTLLAEFMTSHVHQ